MASFQLLIFLGYFATAQAGHVLDCTNDYEKIFCQLAVKECSEYTVNITNDEGYKIENCSLEQCNIDQCCCSVNFLPIPGETHTAKALKGSTEVDTKTIGLSESFKPKTPTIVSVEEFNGNFAVRWMTNMTNFLEPLTAEVTVSKKGDRKKVFKQIKPAVVNGLQSFEISGQDLEPGTVYMVSVRSYTDMSQMFSDRSEEYKFETSGSQSLLFLGIIIVLSVFGIILFFSVYICFVRIKKKLWDSFSDPKKLVVAARKPEYLTPMYTTTSPVLVKPPPTSDDNQMLKMAINQREDASMNQNSSGIDTCSSDSCYGQAEPDHKAIISGALRKALQDCIPKNLVSPIAKVGLPPITQDEWEARHMENETSSGSSGIVNRSYFMSVPSSPNQTMEHNSTDKLQDNSSYSCKSDTVNLPDQQVTACLFSALKDISSPVLVDPSYRPCKVNPKRSSYAENTSLSSTSSDTITCESRVGAGFERSDEVSADSVKVMLLFSSREPSGSDSCAVVVDDYKPFPVKVDQADVLISEKQSSEHHQRLNVNQDGSVDKFSQHRLIPGLNKLIGPCPTVLQTPYFPMMSTELPIHVMMKMGYKCV
ncbi:uncharacterized protein LOC124867521 [Girardinichthys multiradiatus]|uniref:uncharacterized protein LOC124867521 n=1 Tax=Girardinichthys multiradiatus TaxID=208333 RepID=UPI001FAD9042|nr:uncharacterized protein LOC124867521 [Girardinichthys multiradiatus]